MKATYRGHDLTAKREMCLGGWKQVYFMAYRNDGLCVIEDHTEASDPVHTFIKAMKARVDECIETKGDSELLSDCWGDWKEPSKFDAMFGLLKTVSVTGQERNSNAH